MPRIEIEDFDDGDDDLTIRVKIPKPRNPHVRELFAGGQFAPKVQKNKKKETPYNDKRSRWDE